MPTIAQQQKDRRAARLKDVDRQVKSGSLVVRQMTKAERAKYPPRQSSKPAR